MDGTATIAATDLDAFLRAAFVRNAAAATRVVRVWGRTRCAAGNIAWIGQNKPRPPAREERGPSLRPLRVRSTTYFLDATGILFLRLFADRNMTLRAGAGGKKHHIAAKLCSERGHGNVFEIGCGWGGLALTLAAWDYGVKVLGVTPVREQHRSPPERAETRGGGACVREKTASASSCAITARCAAVSTGLVSIGMFELVGLPHYGRVFRHPPRPLTGRHRADPHHRTHRATGATSPWIRKNIFPGGLCPSLFPSFGAVEQADLLPTVIESGACITPRTLPPLARPLHTRTRTRATRALLRPLLPGCGATTSRPSEHTFRHNRQCVFQVQLARRQEAVPLTRVLPPPGLRHPQRPPPRVTRATQRPYARVLPRVLQRPCPRGLSKSLASFCIKAGFAPCPPHPPDYNADSCPAPWAPGPLIPGDELPKRTDIQSIRSSVPAPS